MRAVTIKEAKAHLNALVQAAIEGHTVVLMRGSEHVAAIVPITEDDLELAPRLTDDQAAALWRRVAAARAGGALRTFDSAKDAVAQLRRAGGRAARRRARRSV